MKCIFTNISLIYWRFIVLSIVTIGMPGSKLMAATVNIDTIAPNILEQPMDRVISCEFSVDDSLQVWYQSFASMQAVDNAGPVEYMATLPINEVVAALDNSQSLSCGQTGQVTVGFYAIDTCDNSSDTMMASFEVIDTMGPRFNILPSDIIVTCQPSVNDSINRWLATAGGAEVEDNCVSQATISRYQWTDVLGNSGEARIDDLANIYDGQYRCDYAITVTFVATDECDNMATAIATVTISDTIFPEFEETLSDTLYVTCDNVPSAQNVNVFDNCLGTITPTISDLSTQDADGTKCEHFNYQINRTYTATDSCGNSSSFEQVIYVSDTLEPRFVAPADTIITSVSNPGPDITGFPIDVSDNCSSDFTQSFSDNRQLSDCNVVINRRWTIEDICGSSLILNQRIEVIDEVPPVVISPPINIILDCDSPFDLPSGFEEWVISRGSAIVRDEIGVVARSFAAIPGSYDINDPDTWPGEDPGSLDPAQCPSDRPGLARYEEVDFVFIDNCNNAVAVQGVYGASDETPPEIITEYLDTTLVLDDVNCTAAYTIFPFEVVDNCTSENSQTLTTDIVAITADNMDVPVDPVTLEFGPYTANDLPYANQIALTVQLIRVDADKTQEFFRVFAEDGTLLGQTNIAQNQCANVSTQFEVTHSQLLSWLDDDGLIRFSLEPNIVPGVNQQSINLVCTNSAARGILVLDNIAEYYVTQSVSIDFGEEIIIENHIDTSLDIGTHTVQYIARDCGGNIDTTTQIVEVIDTAAIVIECLGDTSIILAPDMCEQLVTLLTRIEVASPCAGEFITERITIEGPDPRDFEIQELLQDSIQIVLTPGEHQVNYFLNNDFGKTAECSYSIFIIDEEAPQIRCLDTIRAFIPSVQNAPWKIDTAAILEQVSDNCENFTINYDNIGTGCDGVGDYHIIEVIVSDLSGNTSRCESVVELLPFQVDINASAILCPSDSLILEANFDKSDTIEYTYLWSGPNNFLSTQERPVVFPVSDIHSGTYRLTVTGDLGCTGEDFVDIMIEERRSPDITSSDTTLCEGDILELTTTEFDSEVIYEWYEGTAPDGNLIATTDTAGLVLVPSVGDHSYYVLISSQECPDPFSPGEESYVNVSRREFSSLIKDTMLICFGDSLRFEIDTIYERLTYQWNGPNGFVDTLARPNSLVITDADQLGTYELVQTHRGCVDTSLLTVQLASQLPRPIIVAQAEYCSGEDVNIYLANYNDDVNRQYQWYINDSLIIVTATDSLGIVDIDESYNGIWQVVVSDGTCRSDISAPFEVEIITKVDLEIQSPEVICSTDSLTLTVLDLVGVNYEWSGPQNFAATGATVMIPPIGGEYIVIANAGSPCESSDTLEINIGEAPLILSIFSDLDECTTGNKDAVLRTSTFPDVGLEFQWEGPNGFTSTDAEAVIPDYSSSDNGYYYLMVYDNGCPSLRDSFLLSATDIPTTPIIPTILTNCVGESLRIEINGVDDRDISQYSWTTPNGIVATPEPYLDIDQLEQSDAGQYFVRAERSACISEWSDTLALSVFRVPNAPNIVSNLPLCSGSDLILEVLAENDTEYEWTGPDGFTNNNHRITIENFTAEDIARYGVRITKNGCPSDYSYIDEFDIIDIPVKGVIETDDIEICDFQGSSIELCADRNTFVAGVEYIWLNTTNGKPLGRTNDICLNLETLINFENGANTVVLQRVMGECLSDFSEPIIVEMISVPDQNADAGDDVIACQNDNLEISAEQPLRGSGYWSSPDPDVRFEDSQLSTTRVFGLQPGDNYLIWTLTIGACTDYSNDQKVVTLVGNLEAIEDDFFVPYGATQSLDITANDVLSGDYTIEIISQPESGAVEIDPLTLEVIYSADQRYLGRTSFRYEVCSVICPDNCSVGTVNLQVGEETNCFGPTIITPNNDGFNDKLVIPCIESGSFPDNQLYIYNQWGDSVFSGQPYDNTWEGTYKTKALPSGTYYYIFRPTPEAEPIKGFLIIER